MSRGEKQGEKDKERGEGEEKLAKENLFRLLPTHLLGGRALLAVGSRGDHRGLEQDALEDDALVGHVPERER